MLVVKEITMPSFGSQGRGLFQAEGDLSDDDCSRLLDG